MGAAQRPFFALQEDLGWFVSCAEIRVLHIATGGDERATVVQQAALAEGHSRNRAPFFVIEDGHTEGNHGWAMRAARMREIHAARRDAMARAGQDLPALAPTPHADDPFVGMVAQIRQCLAAQAASPPFAGGAEIVLVLAPTRFDDAEAFAESLDRIAAQGDLAGVRFIVVELGEEACAPLARRFGDALLRARAFIDRAALRREMAETLDAAARAPSGASPEMLAGGAGPRGVVAPARSGKPPRDAPLPPAVAAALGAQLGPAAALIGVPAILLRQRILGAASAVQHGRFAEALKLQSEARDQCEAVGLAQLGLVLEIARASYLVLASQRKAARAAYEAAAKRAAAGYASLEAQALLGAAGLAAQEEDWSAAAQLANRAGEAGERSGEAAFAIEGYRCAGKFGLRAGSEKVAIDRWSRALLIARGAPPEKTSLSSAPDVARALAKVLLDNGVEAEAYALLQEAEDLERPPARASGPADEKKTDGVAKPQKGGDALTGTVDLRAPARPKEAPREAPEKPAMTGTVQMPSPLSPPAAKRAPENKTPLLETVQLPAPGANAPAPKPRPVLPPTVALPAPAPPPKVAAKPNRPLEATVVGMPSPLRRNAPVAHAEPVKPKPAPLPEKTAEMPSPLDPKLAAKPEKDVRK